MSDFVEKLRLKEAAEEDLYFAKRDQELIRALRASTPAKNAESACPSEQTPQEETAHDQDQPKG